MIPEKELQEVTSKADKFIKKYIGKSISSIPKEDRLKIQKEVEKIRSDHKKVFEDLLEQIKIKTLRNIKK